MYKQVMVVAGSSKAAAASSKKGVWSVNQHIPLDTASVGYPTGGIFLAVRWQRKVSVADLAYAAASSNTLRRHRLS